MTRVGRLGGLVAAAALAGAACGSPERPVAAGEGQLDWGETVYVWDCARCHDPGRAAPELTRELLGTYEDPLDLYELNRETMPLDDPGSLPDEDYWAVTAYLLASVGLLGLDPDSRLSEENATDAELLASSGDPLGTGPVGTGPTGSPEAPP